MTADARVQRYAEAVHGETWNGIDYGSDPVVAAVMAVADAEQAGLEDRVDALCSEVEGHLSGLAKDARVRALDAAIRRVREIHEPIDAMNYGGRVPRQTRVCTGCGTDNGNWQQWPCPTVRALGVTS